VRIHPANFNAIFLGVIAKDFANGHSQLATKRPIFQHSIPKQMIFLVTPKYIKEGKALLSAAQKLYHYRKDLLSEAKRAEFYKAIQELKSALRGADKVRSLAAMKLVEDLAGGLVAIKSHSAWREHCEVLLVAIVLAAGVRAYFVQPFKIPTGSMQPTLHGIVARHLSEPFPNPVVRFLEFLIFGRNYIDLRSKVDDKVVGLSEKTYLNFFTFTEVRCERETYQVFAPMTQLMQDFGIVPGRLYRAGEIMARGAIESGDQVFVDKLSYHFAPPSWGDVFVFKTIGIRKIQMTLPPGVDSQHYIKRLAGMPGQTLRIDPPILYVNGTPPTLLVFQRVMSMQNGYRGYSNTMANGIPFQYLGSPNSEFVVPRGTYFALGDNSYNSSDSRNWGPVPAQNVVGRAVMVYWPISKRWGFIR